ncbi:hypothetical protein SpCBS45565_g06968 [Spizellomyces sp. 'palustris']|nr:hypothetical protein SpCBS45565_g06968 [Spizellomyces sp. 'palustris']
MGEEVIRLLDSSGNNVLDSVSAEYEDSFSLETFGDLAKLHDELEPKGGKSFLIARVQTWDIKQPGKAFFSYYSAFQLNKILFQTQVYLGKKLIHRLHVLNPLTNTDIIGDVQYFMLRIRRDNEPGQTNPKTQEKEKDKKKEEDLPFIVATAAVEENKDVEGGTMQTISESGVTRRTRRSSPARNRRLIPSIVTSWPPASPTGSPGVLPPPSPSVRDVEAGKLISWTMVAPSVTEITEEEATGPGPQPRKFSLMTLGLKSPYPSPKKGLPLGPRSAYPALGGQGPQEFIITIPPSPTKSPMGSKSFDFGPRQMTPVDDRRGTSLDIRVVTKPPPGIMQMHGHRRNNRTQVAVGSVTRFAKPVSPEDLRQVSPTPKGRRRAYSYINSAAAAAGEGLSPTFEEWLQMVRQDQERDGRATEDGDPYDTVSFIGASPTKQTTEKGKKLSSGPPSESTTQLLADKISHQSSATLGRHPPSMNIAPVTFYDAILFATDADYLESSRIRAIFRQNAVTLEDVKLFEMPEYTGLDTPPPVVIIDDSPLCEWCYPSAVTLQQYSGPMRVFHRVKCWILLLLVVIAGFLFIFFMMKNQNYTPPASIRGPTKSSA